MQYCCTESHLYICVLDQLNNNSTVMIIIRFIMHCVKKNIYQKLRQLLGGPIVSMSFRYQRVLCVFG